LTVADREAQAWGGRVVRLLANRENVVHEMALPGSGRAALRLHRAGYQSQAAIRSELWWCTALADAGVAVPRPLAALSGDMLMEAAPGIVASAIRWAKGEPLGAGGAPLTGTVAHQVQRFRALGLLLAQLHDATDRLTLPPWFERPDWGIDGLTGDAPHWGRFWEHPALTPDEARQMRRARDGLRERLTDHAAQDGDRGLIHADVLRENVLVEGDALTLIDFDDSGTGFRGLDLGTALVQNLAEPAFTDLRAALVEGYGERRPVCEHMVPVFTLARALASVGWTMPRLAPGDPVHRSHIARALACAADVLP